MTDTATTPLHPVSGQFGTHYFTAEELQASLTRMLGELPADRDIGLGIAADMQGVGVGIMWQKHPEAGGWTPAASVALTRDWSGNIGFGGKFTLSK